MIRKYLYIAIAIILTSMISVSLHIAISQYFPAPIITISPSLNQTMGFLIRFCTAIASIFIYVLSKKYWLSVQPVQRIILFAILIMALTESLFRVTIMNIIVGNSWQSQMLLAIPRYLKFFSLSFVICLLANPTFQQKIFQLLYYMALAILATTLFILIGYLVTIPNTTSNTTPPHYGINILIPAYVTYLEPTIASFIVFYLIKNKLNIFNVLMKGIIMGGIISLIHAGIYSILQIVCSEGNIFYRIFYYGQFLWEYFALSILTAYSFYFLKIDHANMDY